MFDFGRPTKVNACVKQLLACFHGGFLWLDESVEVTMGMISYITGFPKDRPDPSQYYFDRRRCSPEQSIHIWGFVFLLLKHLYRGMFSMFSSPWVFPKINLCVLLYGCACLFFSDHFAYGYVVMMINVIRSDITIKNLTWDTSIGVLYLGGLMESMEACGLTLCGYIILEPLLCTSP